jgi:hypothetical protein
LILLVTTRRNSLESRGIDRSIPIAASKTSSRQTGWDLERAGYINPLSFIKNVMSPLNLSLPLINRHAVKLTMQNAEQHIGELPLLSPVEKHQLLIEWNETSREYVHDRCIHQLFEEQVQRTPDRLAVVFEDEQITYGELNRKANQLAHHLQALGVGAETLVGVHLERSIKMDGCIAWDTQGRWGIRAAGPALSTGASLFHVERRGSQGVRNRAASG